MTTKEKQMNWKHYRTALLSALDSVGRYDVLTPAELDAVATHLAASGIESLRDEFAGQAITSILIMSVTAKNFRTVDGGPANEMDIAYQAYALADAMLIARNETVEKIEEAG